MFNNINIDPSDTTTQTTGAKQYELTNHLGNVLATITDKGVITSAQDYYPFGLTLASRSFTAGNSYRYSFNGKEDDKELKQQDYGMRIYRKDLGRFLSVDPLGRDYPELTPYQFAGNNPIKFIDLDGLEPATSPADAQGAIDKFEKDDNATSNWSKTNKANFVASLRELVNNPESINQTNATNFCGKAAAATVGFRDNPLGLTNFLIELYQTGSATYDNYKGKGVTIALTDEMKKNMDLEISSDAYGTGEKLIKTNPAFSLLAHAQTLAFNPLGKTSFKGAATANSQWASTLAVHEENLIEDFYGYKIERSDASNTYLFRGRKSLAKAENAANGGSTVIGLVNSRMLHNGNFKGRPLIMTHFIVMKPNGKKWEYGFSEPYDLIRMVKAWCGSIIVKPADNQRKE